MTHHVDVDDNLSDLVAMAMVRCPAREPPRLARGPWCMRLGLALFVLCWSSSTLAAPTPVVQLHKASQLFLLHERVDTPPSCPTTA